MSAQETLDLEEAQRVAVKINSALGVVKDAPLKVVADLIHPQALKAEPVGLMIIPDLGFDAEKLTALSESITPVGQLWMLAAQVSTPGHPLSAADLRIVKVGDGGEQKSVQLYLIGAVKSAAGVLELVLFGAGKEPIARIPVTKVESRNQALPLEISGRQSGEDSGIVTVNLLGQYRAEVPVVRAIN